MQIKGALPGHGRNHDGHQSKVRYVVTNRSAMRATFIAVTITWAWMGRAQLKRRPTPPDDAIASPAATLQRQTYEPFTSTRTQPEAAAPTAAPPTTARRVDRRATPATLTGVNGRPTLACALSTATEGTRPVTN